MPTAEVTTPEAAKITGYTRQRILQLIKAGDIPAREFGGRWCIKRKDLADLKKPPGRPRNGARR